MLRSLDDRHDSMPRRSFSGWGRFSVEECGEFRIERHRDPCVVVEAYRRQSHWIGGMIGRGLGRSYGDAAVNGGGVVVLSRGLDRLLAFDPATGVLECEAGVSFEEILDVFVPRGWFLPVTPGTQFVTVGGAIAADVHGKNHHVDGSLGEFVRELRLVTGTGEVLRCSREENADVFCATIGGMGLTGFILSASIRLRPIETSWMAVTTDRAPNLDAALATFAASDATSRYSVAWIDCLARGGKLGRSVILQGDHARRDELDRRAARDPLARRRPRGKRVPVDFPGFALNPWSVGLFNAAYWRLARTGRRLVDPEPFFYPLDAVRDWNRMYGRRGFVQYQAFLPRETSQRGLVALLEKVTASRIASFLAVLKACGARGPGIVSFLEPGHTLALDLPNRGAALRTLLGELDRIVLDHGGRLYLAKDAAASAATMREMYPSFEELRELKGRIDPENVFQSSQSRRLGITDEGTDR